MRELYTEGVAIHGDPESCVDVREGAGEALTGARAGRAIEPRNHQFGVPTLSKRAEGNIAGGAIASRQRTPRGRRTWHVRNLHAREPGDPTAARPVDHGPGRSGKAKAARLRCTGVGSRTAP